MAKDQKEWFLQSEYDYESAQAMFQAGKYIYSVFMCHLSIEKYLKGIYRINQNVEPPRVHSLVFLVEVNKISVPESLRISCWKLMMPLFQQDIPIHLFCLQTNSK